LGAARLRNYEDDIQSRKSFRNKRRDLTCPNPAHHVHLSFLNHLLAHIHTPRLASSTCFLPNGTESTSLGAQPCSLDPSNPLSSTCCNTKWENVPGGDLKFGQPKDECLPNGLCQNRGMSTIQGKEAAPWTHFYRVYCTSKDWSGCLSVCDTGVRSTFLGGEDEDSAPK
jgi:hypothetical protein